MRKVKIRTVEEMMALPEGEWVEVPDGLDLEVAYEGTVRVEGNRLTVDLPKGAAKELGSFARGPLRAEILNGKLVVERKPDPAVQKRRSRLRS